MHIVTDMPVAELPVWQQAANEKREMTDSAIPAEWRLPQDALQASNSTMLPYTTNIMTEKELKITESRAVDLLELLKTKVYGAVEVTTAFCKRAAIAHQATNCVAHVMFSSALQQARELDEFLETTGQTKGVLHGLPISVKEHIYLKGTPATSGLVAWKDNIIDEDALIVKIFREAGAVFHVKTTNPQTLMSLETSSNLFGRTTNPYNRNLTSGGSSGGESALLAMRGSVLGIGTDIGGSIRVPSAFTGGYGLKCSIARLPHGGLSGLHAGMEAIVGCVGPMANSLADLSLSCKVALDYQPWRHEPSLMPIPWHSHFVENLPKKLKIGVLWHDGMVQPHPPVIAALRHSVDLLRSAGHEIVSWDSAHLKETFKWINNAYFMDEGDEYRAFTDSVNDPCTTYMKFMLDTYATKRYTLEESWRINVEHDRVRTLHAEQLRSTGVDAILSPVHPSVAAAHNEAIHWGYSAVFNALDLPGVVLPVGTVNEMDTWDGVGMEQAEPMSEMDALYRVFYDAGPAKYKDAPTSVQLVGERLQEEKLMAIAEVLDELLRKDRDAVKRSVVEQTGDCLPRETVPVNITNENVAYEEDNESVKVNDSKHLIGMMANGNGHARA